MYILSIDFATPEYDEAVALRYAVLRQPLGLEFTEEQLAAEHDQIHLAAYSDHHDLIGYLNLTPRENRTVQMRQVAVRPEWQSRGVGKALVEASEEVARQHGYLEMVLHAREGAVAFYRHLLYNPEGQPFEEVTIPHLAMRKRL